MPCLPILTFRLLGSGHLILRLAQGQPWSTDLNQLSMTNARALFALGHKFPDHITVYEAGLPPGCTHGRRFHFLPGTEGGLLPEYLQQAISEEKAQVCLPEVPAWSGPQTKHTVPASLANTLHCADSWVEIHVVHLCKFGVVTSQDASAARHFVDIQSAWHHELGSWDATFQDAAYLELDTR